METTEQGGVTRRSIVQMLLTVAGAILAGCTPSRRGGPQALEALRNKITGTVTLKDEGPFEALRAAASWNARKSPHAPDVIVQASSVADVQETVAFAREQGLKVALRSGGHHWSSPSLQPGGVLLDVGALRDVRIDAANKRAIVGPGLPNAELGAKLAQHGLAFPIGHCPTVSLGGYLLGGGFGWNAGAWGVACWNVVGIDLVTADGRLVHASEKDNAELFWAARGAGSGFFGAIVSYELQLFDLPQAIETSTLVFPLEQAAEVAAWLEVTAPKLPVNVEHVLWYVSAPPELSNQHERVCIVTAHAFAASHEEAVRALAPFAACPLDKLAEKHNVATPFPTLFEAIARRFPEGKRYGVDSIWLSGKPAELLGQAAQRYTQAPSADSLMVSAVIPPPPADAPPLPDCAYTMVGPILVNVYAVWDDEAADEENLGWLRGTEAQLAEATIGHYVGEADLEANPEHTRRSFSEAGWQRLAELRKRHDPRGVFHAPPGA